MEISFEGKNVIVTGAGRGIGKGICIGLAKCGANVIALSKTEANLRELKKEAPTIEIVCVDLSNWEETRSVMRKIAETRKIHCLVNNAAIALLKPFMDITSEDFDNTMNINVKSIVNVSQVVAQNMIKHNIKGAIVNISSQAAMAALTDHAVYCASKGALDALSRVMALELGPQGIRINCVNPTVIMTEMGRLGWSDPARAEPMIQKIPLKRFGEVSEVVDAVIYLLSDRASMITGVSLPVDGGFLAC